MNAGGLEPLVLGLLGAGGGFVSGLLGIGGAVVLIPMLAFVPPALGMSPYGMGEIAGMSLAQVLAASLVGGWTHLRAGFLPWRAALPMAAASGGAAIVGGLASRTIPDRVLETAFAALALVAALLMVWPVAGDAHRTELPEGFSVAGATLAATFTGLLSGVLGVGGAFLLSPLMRTVFGMPIRLVIGTSLAVVLAASGMGTLGKALAGLVPWHLAVFLVVGSLVGAPLGAKLSHRLHGNILRWLLAALIAGAGFKMALQVLASR